MDRPKEDKPAAVFAARRTTQAGEAPLERWAWVEPTAWTVRMLTALEKGVKGGIWFSLIDKVWTRPHLERAFEKVKANQGAAGVDHVTVEQYEAQREQQMAELMEALKTGRYRPQAIRRVYIPKPGSRESRPLGIPTVRDRVVQMALKDVLEPIWERDFAAGSYGFRPGRGAKDALRAVDRQLKAGDVWVVDADIQKYFDTIPQQRLMAAIRRKVADGRVLALVEGFLNQPVMEGLATWTPEEGTPQGAVLSPLLANLYLDPLDHRMAEHGHTMVRYADDFVILCPSQGAAEQALEAVRQWMAEAGLTLHPEKTRIVDARQPGGFDFLGYHFERGYRWPRRKSLGKLKEAIRAKTRRTHGHSLDAIIADVNRTLRGWFEYFKHSHWTTFRPLDSWIRMRLRSILRKRCGRRGRGQGEDHHRWPNAFLAEQGLFSLVAAHERLRQPALR